MGSSTARREECAADGFPSPHTLAGSCLPQALHTDYIWGMMQVKTIPIELQTPRSLDHAALAIMTPLGIDHSDHTMLQKVKTFVRCNGYTPVARAAGTTHSAQQRGAISDPWAYTVSTFNTNLVLLEQLYQLTRGHPCCTQAHSLASCLWLASPVDRLESHRPLSTAMSQIRASRRCAKLFRR